MAFPEGNRTHTLARVDQAMIQHEHGAVPVRAELEADKRRCLVRWVPLELEEPLDLDARTLPETASAIGPSQRASESGSVSAAQTTAGAAP